MVGEYRMLQDSLVRIAEEIAPNTYHITFVSVDGCRVFSGGGCFPVRAKELRQITSPGVRAAARVFEARRLATEYDRLHKEQEREEAKWQAVMGVLRECREAKG